MATARKIHVPDCGAMSCDPTGLLLKAGRIDLAESGTMILTSDGFSA